MSQELDQMRVRREKMEELKEAGIEPFGRRFKRDHLAQDLHDKFDQYDKEELNEMGAKVITPGDFSLGGPVCVYLSLPFGSIAFLPGRWSSFALSAFPPAP